MEGACLQEPKYKIGQLVMMRHLHADESAEINALGIILKIEMIEYDEYHRVYSYRIYFQGEERDYLYLEHVLDDLVEVIENDI
jgi:hypothetical protein